MAKMAIFLQGRDFPVSSHKLDIMPDFCHFSARMLIFIISRLIPYHDDAVEEPMVPRG